MKRLLIVDISTRVIFHTALVGSLYLLFAGHNRPGGGFVGGLVAGAAVALRFIAGGIDEVRGLTRVFPWTILGAGLAFAGGTALAPVLLGKPVLTNALWELEVPVLGTVKTTSALIFDIGVYLTVVGLVFMLFEAFGDDAPEDADRPPAPTRSASVDSGREGAR